MFTPEEIEKIKKGKVRIIFTRHKEDGTVDESSLDNLVYGLKDEL
jgi:hypothetical protein